MTTCPRCHTPNPDDARFCDRCGQPLGGTNSRSGEATRAVTPPPARPTPTPARGGLSPTILVAIGVACLLLLVCGLGTAGLAVTGSGPFARSQPSATPPPATATTAPSPTTATQDPAAVIKAAYYALNSYDIDEVLSYYTDDGTITFRPRQLYNPPTLTGKDQIRGNIQDAQQENLHSELSNIQVQGERVTFNVSQTSDSGRRAGLDPFLSTGEAVVVNGKIESLTLTLTPEMLAKLKAAGVPNVPDNPVP